MKVAASPVNPSDDGTWKVTPSHGLPAKEKLNVFFGFMYCQMFFLFFFWGG